MANKQLVIDAPNLSLDQKVLGLLMCIAQEKKGEIERRISGTVLSFLQLNLLHALSHAPEGCLTVSQLKAALVDERPNVSRALNKLVELGLARKQRSEEDQRTVFVFITGTGERAHKEGDARLHGLSTGLGEADLRQLYALLTKL